MGERAMPRAIALSSATPTGGCLKKEEPPVVLGSGRESAGDSLCVMLLIAVSLTPPTEPLRSSLFDCGTDGSFGTAHTDHSTVIARLESLDRPIFRRHPVTSCADLLTPLIVLGEKASRLGVAGSL